jgi:molybdopterin synthase catalytic subunit
MNKVKVLFFASLKDRIGVNETVVELPENASVRDLKQSLLVQFPQLFTSVNSVLISVNNEFAFDEDIIPTSAEVSFFPPVSGGSKVKPPTELRINEVDIDLNEIIDSIKSTNDGAICIFTGIVRGFTKIKAPHQTLFLDYEAYTSMALSKMEQVANEIREHWPSVHGIAIVQRIGRLYPGAPTVVIACCASHRDEGVFEAARFGIDRLKEIVPIWKKEISPNGETWVEGDYIPNRND